jgi:hypothetical protein
MSIVLDLLTLLSFFMLTYFGVTPSTEPEPDPDPCEDYCFNVSCRTFAALGKSTRAYSLFTNFGITFLTSST